jgi:hypothetical protein
MKQSKTFSEFRHSHRELTLAEATNEFPQLPKLPRSILGVHVYDGAYFIFQHPADFSTVVKKANIDLQFSNTDLNELVRRVWREVAPEITPVNVIDLDYEDKVERADELADIIEVDQYLTRTEARKIRTQYEILAAAINKEAGRKVLVTHI